MREERSETRGKGYRRVQKKNRRETKGKRDREEERYEGREADMY